MMERFARYEGLRLYLLHSISRDSLLDAATSGVPLTIKSHEMRCRLPFRARGSIQQLQDFFIIVALHVLPSFVCEAWAALTSGGSSELHRQSAQGPLGDSCVWSPHKLIFGLSHSYPERRYKAVSGQLSTTHQRFVFQRLLQLLRY